MKSLSLKSVRAVLTKASFNPNKPGPIKPIVDADSFEYFLNRALEMIYTAKVSNRPQEHLIPAIQVLVLAILKNNENTTTNSKTLG